MNPNKELDKNTWELRRISLTGDKASLGLALFLEGKKDKGLLQEGINFCDGLLAILQQDIDDALCPADSKAAVLKNEAGAAALERIGLSHAQTPLRLSEIKASVESLLHLEPDNIDENERTKIQEELLTLKVISMIFYQKDLDALRQLKGRRSLRAYG